MCRDPAARKPGRPIALRLRVPDDERRLVSFDDVLHGHHEEDVAATAGDFVLRRGDGIASYQLAVVVDDAAMEIDEVVRGDDLLPSTGRQVLLARLLGARSPRWLHLPVVRGPDGERLAKRHQSAVRGTTIRELREAGISAAEVLSAMRAGLSTQAVPWVPPAHWLVPR
jgi:glutamyl-tRNA synthetase